MARTNKYASVNFNEIYEKKFSNNNPVAKPTNPINSPLPSKTIISNSRIQGNMLVLTRPTPKPISLPPPLDVKPPNPVDQAAPQVEAISLRPQGRTGPAPSLAQAPLVSGSGSSFKTNKFVPPHLRPGFVGREEKPVGPGGRPKSGGGYDINHAPGYSNNHYASRGTRPNSSG